ncbi:MAG: HEPN domain-containing protein [Euryarchaeota archaeon]|nr:HEPN domain-containing protein [Euryarchaeota archaeon]
MSEFERCVEDRRLIHVQASDKMIEKESNGAKYDLKRAEESLRNGDCKWASVQAYYSMFHAAKALVLRRGYREKSHYCLLIALRDLYVNAGELGEEFADNFEMAMDIRHEADYALSYDEESAKIAVRNAERFLHKAQEMLARNGGKK